MRKILTGNQKLTFLYAGEALMCKDDYCMNYLAKFREGAFDI